MTSYSFRRAFCGVLGATAMCAGAASILPAEAPLAAGVLPIASAQTADPALAQTVTDAEHFTPRGQSHVFTRGHADLGVRVDEGPGHPASDGVSLMLRDDATEQPTWRHLDDVVFRVDDKSKQNLPEDGTYAFTGAAPGASVWVLPQTEIQGVPWLGWNTQSPALIKEAGTSGGVTMDLLGHQGPGQMSMFLQAGGFSQPQVLWNTAQPVPQSMWVDMNTHAHANWVFTEAGVHHVAVGVTVTMPDGSKRHTTKVLTFAVGVSTDQAQQSSWQGELPTVESARAQSGQNDPAQASQGEESSSGSLMTWLLVGLGVLVVALVAGYVLVMRSARSVRAQAEQAARDE